MRGSSIVEWLDSLWEAVCVRAAYPLPGLALDREGIEEVARRTFGQFMESGGDPESSLKMMLSVLTRRVQGCALGFVAEKRRGAGDPNLYRDSEKARWESNPEFPDLVSRGKDGVLASEGWVETEKILWKRASVIYRRLGIKDHDARDVYSEAVADFLKARTDPAGCPFRKMLVFEEVPRLFAAVAERRGISWIRKQGTRRMEPNQSGLSFDDPEIKGIEGRLPEEGDSLVNATFDRIRAGCGGVLTELEWHLIEVIFVEEQMTRDQLIQEKWIPEVLGVKLGASRSTKLRRLNDLLVGALTNLGKALEEVDGV